MAITKYDVASAALVMIGANPVASFDSGGSTEEVACFHLYQPTLDHWLSLYPWRFATRTSQLSRIANPPGTQWQAGYVLPADIKALQAIRTNFSDRSLPYDRYENTVRLDATDSDVVWAVHTYDPPVAWWPGYFLETIQLGLAAKLSFAISGKLDLQAGLEKSAFAAFRLAKNADSRQQTTRQFNLRGRRSIMESRLS